MISAAIFTVPTVCTAVLARRYCERMKGSEKPKKLQKKDAQKTLKEKRSAKKAKKAKPSSF